MTIPFWKMHGLGNDFVVLDARKRPIAMDAARARAIADRKTGVGCDQFIVLEPAQKNGQDGGGAADLFMRIRNADGGEVEACGNATRCIAKLVFQETGRDHAAIQTGVGLLLAEDRGDGQITVNMGSARLDWRDIPLSQETDTLHIPLNAGPLRDAVGVNVGNPHAVYFVEDVAAIDLEDIGPKLEHDAWLPERGNINIAEVTGTDQLRHRVWERGVGITRACGTGACATAVAAHRRGLTGRKVDVDLDGGRLQIEWRKSDDHVLMTGPTALSFSGTLSPDLYPEA